MKYLIFIFLTLLHLSGYAQILKVIDRETGEPLPLVTIVSENPMINTTTNEQGEANIADFKTARKIEIRFLGYTTEIFSYKTLQESGFVIQLFHAGLSVDDIVVTATRIGLNARDLPFQAATLSARDVALQNPQTAADLLGTSGKIFIQKSQQGGGSPMIRGFAANRLLYTVDGVRMNNAIFRGGNLQNVISLDPFTIEKTDIFFGPGSVIYGSDALGGVMSFQTLTPKFSNQDKMEFSGVALGRYASANQEKTGHLHINSGGQKWALVTSISGNDFGDLKMGKHGPDEYLRPFYVERINGEDVIIQNEDPLLQVPSGYRQFNFMQKIRYRPNDRWDFNYGFHISGTTDYSRYDRHIRYQQGEPRYGEWSYGPQKWLMNLLQIDHQTENTFFDVLTIRLAQQQMQESRRDRDINDPIRRVRGEKVDAYSVNFDLSKEVDAQRKLFYGFEAVLNRVHSNGIDQDIARGEEYRGPSRYPQADWSSLGLYLTYQESLSEGLIWQSGLRYSHNHIDANFDTTFYPFPFTHTVINKGSMTGSMGLIYRPVPSWVITGNFATGFRAPNVDDIGKVFDSEPGSVVVPNPDLKAEYAYNLEVGIARVFRDFLKFDLSAYYTLLDNAMVRRDYTLNNQDSIIYDGTKSQVQAIQNAAQAEIYGLQAGLELRIWRGFIFNTNINLQTGVEELDDGTTSASRHAAPTYGTSRLSYAGEKIRLQLYAVYSAGVTFADLAQEERGKPEIYAIDEEGNPWSPGWHTINFKGSYAISPAVTINAGLENITGQRYRPYSSGIVAAGTNLIVSLRAEI